MVSVKFMACQVRSVIHYKNLRTKFMNCCANIYFNRQCLSKKVLNVRSFLKTSWFMVKVFLSFRPSVRPYKYGDSCPKNFYEISHLEFSLTCVRTYQFKFKFGTKLTDTLRGDLR